MADEPVTPPASANAPAFVDSGVMAAAQELTRVNAELAKAQAARDAAVARTKELEGQVDQTKQADLEKQIADLSSKNAALEAEAQTLKDTATVTERSQALTGKVADPAAAQKLLDPEKHLNKDGTVNTEALLSDFPFLAPSAQPAATSPDGAGGAQNMPAGNSADLDKAVASGSLSAVNAAFEAALTAK